MPALAASLAQTCFAATSVVHYWGAAPTPAALACYQHFPARTASASGCSRQFVLLRRTRIQSVPPSLLPRAVVSPSKQSVTGGNALPGDNCLCTAVALSPPTCQTFTEQKHLFHKAANDPCHALRRQISSHRIPMCPTMPTAPLRMDCEFRLREVILGRARRAFFYTGALPQPPPLWPAISTYLPARPPLAAAAALLLSRAPGCCAPRSYPRRSEERPSISPRSVAGR